MPHGLLRRHDGCAPSSQTAVLNCELQTPGLPRPLKWTEGGGEIISINFAWCSPLNHLALLCLSVTGSGDTRDVKTSRVHSCAGKRLERRESSPHFVTLFQASCFHVTLSLLNLQINLSCSCLHITKLMPEGVQCVSLAPFPFCEEFAWSYKGNEEGNLLEAVACA